MQNNTLVDCGEPPVNHASIKTVTNRDLLYDDVYVNRQITVGCDEQNYEEVYLYPPGADTTLTCPTEGPSEWNYDSNNFYCALGQLLASFLGAIFEFLSISELSHKSQTKS